jgi:hypothetical protein
MVRTVAKVGRRAGPPLWRCSDFSCPEIVNIDEGDITPRTPAAGESAQAQFERERAAFRERAKQMFVVFAALPVLFATIGFLATAWAVHGLGGPRHPRQSDLRRLPRLEHEEEASRGWLRS